MFAITSKKPMQQLLLEMTTVIIIKIIFLYIIWSIVFSQRDPATRTTQAMTSRLLSQTINQEIT
jgi:hypothetical protein